MTVPAPWRPAEALRGAPGVRRLLGLSTRTSRMAYVVSDDGRRILVLDKLSRLADAHGMPMAQVVEQAWVSPLEAVSDWGIVPYPYQLQSAPGPVGYLIRHTAFNALLPGWYPTPAAAAPALARLLQGAVLPGDGDFTYRGQPLTLVAPLDPGALPPCPLLTLDGAHEHRSRKRLPRLDYVGGFGPLTESVFARVRLLESAWVDQCAGVAREVRAPGFDGRLAAVLARHADAGPASTLDREGRQRLIQLADRYLQAEHPPALFGLGHGAIAGDQQVCDVDHTVAAGEVAALALVRDARLADALHLAWRWHRYDQGLRATVRRIESATLFLMDDRQVSRPAYHGLS